MKIQLMSDLHLECHADCGYEFVSKLECKADVLVLAGDILYARDYPLMKEQIGWFCQKYPYVIYLPGNHEYWGSNPRTVNKNLNRLPQELGNLSVLSGDTRMIKLGNQIFLGGTLWFQQLNPLEETLKAEWSDFRHIKELDPWVFNQSTTLRCYLSTHCEPGDIVITHHLPHSRSSDPRYAQYANNCFFINDMSDLLGAENAPKLWLHGHTHSQVDYELPNNAKTRVVANPLGYPNEYESLTSFKGSLIINT